MNLFILDLEVDVCATYHVDKHVVKMPTETAQMLSFLYHDKKLWDKNVPEFIMAFSKGHNNHPCTVWLRQSIDNFMYGAKLGLALYNEYQYRYNKPDKHIRAKQIFTFALNNPPNLPEKGLTKFAEAMPDEYRRHNCAIKNYQMYYNEDKKHLHVWTKRSTPLFINTKNQL
jgi:hypothetical protein